ncbi:hypothetical protein [Ralstonia sp. 24A2]|uniref:hypothetical protein n=1 Tax=Ralstonia sp. 24A2 TaxID=3447364 RepID=UPI003F698513
MAGTENEAIGFHKSEQKRGRTFQARYVHRHPPYDQWEERRRNALLPSIKTSLPNAGIVIFKTIRGAIMASSLAFGRCTGLIVLLVATVVMPAAFADSGASQTPESTLAESAKTYLGSLEGLKVFKRSYCGYALRAFLSVDTAIAAEVLPAFPPYARSAFSNQLQGLKPLMTTQAQDYVDHLIVAAKQEQDKNLACGTAARALAEFSYKAYQNWLETKRQYSMRPSPVR